MAPPNTPNLATKEHNPLEISAQGSLMMSIGPEGWCGFGVWWKWTHVKGETETERNSETEIETHGDREADRETDGQIERERKRGAGKRDSQRETDRQIHRENKKM